jgi:hypothetical protein
MNRKLLIAALVFANAAFAQQAGEDLSGTSARKLTKDETQQLLSGANTSSVFSNGNQYTMEFKTDGSISGYQYSRGGKGGMASRGETWTITGSWTVSDDGQVCREYKVITPRASTDYKNCPFVLRLADGRLVYSSSGDVSGRGTVVEIKK